VLGAEESRNAGRENTYESQHCVNLQIDKPKIRENYGAPQQFLCCIAIYFAVYLIINGLTELRKSHDRVIAVFGSGWIVRTGTAGPPQRLS
jgi:hypothetical protein